MTNIFYKESYPVMFLDIDGPLIPQRAYWLKRNALGRGHSKWFDPVAVELFNDIFYKVPKLKIVFSTSWAEVYSNDLMFDFFKLNGLNITQEMLCEEDRTPKKNDSKRGEEIQWWLDKHPHITNFVIVDDSRQVLTVDPEKTVLVDFNEGFLFAHYIRTLTILNFEFDPDGIEDINAIKKSGERYILT